MAAAEVDSWRIYDVDDPDPGYFEFDWISARFPDLYDRFAISTSVGMEELCCLIDLEGLVVVDVGAGTGRSAIAAAGGRGVRGIIQVLQVLVDLAPSRRARGEDFQIAQHVTASGDPRPDVVRVKTYRDVLGLHATHPEPKNLGPDGQPRTRSTRGLLSRRPITASTIELIGKESHRLEERTVGLIGELSQVVTTYPHPEYDAWAMLVLPVLATTSTSLLADRTGLDARTIQRLRKGES